MKKIFFMLARFGYHNIKMLRIEVRQKNSDFYIPADVLKMLGLKYVIIT